MKTVLISGGNVPLPDTLRDVISRGSTSVDERTAADVNSSGSLAGADRVVFWASSGDDAIRALAVQYARANMGERKDGIVFVTTASTADVPGLAETDVFVWPRDEDRLTMAFLTGA